MTPQEVFTNFITIGGFETTVFATSAAILRTVQGPRHGEETFFELALSRNPYFYSTVMGCLVAAGALKATEVLDMNNSIIEAFFNSDFKNIGVFIAVLVGIAVEFPAEKFP